MTDCYNKVIRSYDTKVQRHRRLPDGTYVAYWVRGTITVSVDMEKLAMDMASCLYNKGRRSVKACGVIVAKSTNVEESLA